MTIMLNHKIYAALARSVSIKFVNGNSFAEDVFGYSLFFCEFGNGTAFEPCLWDDRTESKCVGLGFLTCLFTNAVKICGHACIWGVHEEMRKFVEHDKQFFVMP